MKGSLLFRILLLTSIMVFSNISRAQLFTQDFSSSTNLADYTNATAPTNAQFNAISSTGSGVVVSINNGQLRYVRNGSNSGSFSRSSNFSPAPTSLIYTFDITVSGNNASTTTSAVWQVGSGYGNGNSAEANNITHSRIGLNISANNGEFSLRNIGGSTSSANFSGKQTVSWYINNSGNSLSYNAPNGTTQIVGNDTFDVWVGSVQIFDEVAATTPAVELKNFKFVINGGVATVDIDNININSFPTSSPKLETGGIGNLSDFTYNEGFGPSASQYFSLSGNNLNPNSGNISVVPPASYEVSVDNSTFSTSELLIPYSSGTLPQGSTKIYVRLKAGLSANIYSNESITISGGGAPASSVLCSGVVMKPSIVLGNLTTTALNYPLGNGPSPSANASVSGINLNDNVVIMTGDSTKWEVSKDNLNWSSSVSYTPIAGTLKSTENKIYVRLKAGLPISIYATNLSANSSYAVEQSVPITGQVLQPLIKLNEASQNFSLSGFDYDELQGPSLRQSFRVDGVDLAGDINVTASDNWEISTNQTYDGSNYAPFNNLLLYRSSANEVNNKNIYIRLKNNLPVGNYVGTITISSPNATSRSVNVSGKVNPAKVDMKVTGGSGKIDDGSTTASPLNNTLFAAQNLGNSQTKQYTITNKGGSHLILSEITILGTGATDFSIINPPAVGTELKQDQSVSFEIKFAPTTVGSKTATLNIYNNDPDNNPYDFVISGNANFCGGDEELVIAQQGFEETPVYTELTYSISGNINVGNATGFVTGTSGSGDKPTGNKLSADGFRGYRIQGVNAGFAPYIFNFDKIDTSIYTNIDLSIRVAGFSLGSNSDGMDPTNNRGEFTNIDQEKIDFVLVEISPDGGTNWYPQAKIVSDVSNLAWSFGSSGTTSGSREYAANNSITYFKSNSERQYSEIIIKNLPSVTQLKVRISAQSNETNESWILDDIRIVSSGPKPKIWNGSSWSPSAPQKSDKIIISGDFNTQDSGGNLQVCQCEINSGTLTVAEETSLVISDKLVNNGTIVVENDANFVQVNEINSNTGSGKFIVKRNANMRRLDYTYWSSPVKGQKLKDFSPGTLNTRFSVYNQDNDLFEGIDPLSHFFGDNKSGFESEAKGYSIRANNSYPASNSSGLGAIQLFQGVFKGTVNNGGITFPLQYKNSGSGNGYNLIGNPYPSNIDFYQLADHNSDLISKTAYFWTNINPNPSMRGSGYPGEGYISNYAILNGTGGVPVTLGSDEAIKSSTPTSTIKVGQGFIVKAKKGGPLTFNNALRVKDTSGVFFNKNIAKEGKTEIDRFWIHLKSPKNVIATTLVGYIEKASDDYEEDYDAELFGLGADAIFSELDNRRLAIQGRKFPLNGEDGIKMGTNHYESGDYTIYLGQLDGIFKSNQSIYLKDNITNTVTDLTNNAYTFQAEKGLTEGRFKIIYQAEKLLETINVEKDELIVYRDGQDFIIKAKKPITSLEVYDISGKLIYVRTSLKNEIKVDGTNLVEGIYVMKILLNKNWITKKIIK